jgi:hypothetical protein
VLEKVQRATVRVAVPVIEAVVDSNLQGQGSLLVLGVTALPATAPSATTISTAATTRRSTIRVSRTAGLDHPVEEFADKNHIASAAGCRSAPSKGETLPCAG